MFAVGLIVAAVAPRARVGRSFRWRAVGVQVHDLAAVRDTFEATWGRWNIARAVADTAALGCLTWALVLSERAMTAC